MPVSDLHRQVASAALAAAAGHGFALAGGNALLAYGIITRPTQDVDLLRSYSNRADLLTRLTDVCRRASRPDARDDRNDLTLPNRSVQRRRVRDRLTDADIERLIAEFLAGTSKRELAGRYGISFSAVKALLRRHGVRRT
jgi:Nucleotidyl transferase AbiEii toxin, Type IV TA system